MKAPEKRPGDLLPDPRFMSPADYANRFGMLKKTLYRVYSKVEASMVAESKDKRSITGGLEPFYCFTLCVEFLRRLLTHTELAGRYGICRTYVTRILHHFLPVLRANVDTIRDPAIPKPFFDETLGKLILGSMDCCFHKRHAVHPGQKMFYRFDKASHGLSVQLLCAQDGRILSVQIFLGHNNDVACLWNSTVPGSKSGEKEVELADWLASVNKDTGAIVLVDGGYNVKDLPGLFTSRWVPKEIQMQGVEKEAEWKDDFHGRRSIVERVFGRVANWKLASTECYYSVEYQSMGLMLIYWLVNEDLVERPLFASNGDEINQQLETTYLKSTDDESVEQATETCPVVPLKGNYRWLVPRGHKFGSKKT